MDYCHKALGNIRCRKQRRDCILSSLYQTRIVVYLDSINLAYVYKLAVMPIVLDYSRNAQNSCQRPLFRLTVLHGTCLVAYRTTPDGLIPLCRSALWYRLRRLSICVQSCTSQLTKFCHCSWCFTLSLNSVKCGGNTLNNGIVSHVARATVQLLTVGKLLTTDHVTVQ